MPATATLDLAGLARLHQVALGLAPASSLPDAETYLDEEGTPVARASGGDLELLSPAPWQRPGDVASALPVTVAGADRLPDGDIDPDVLVLVPLGGVRPDDSRRRDWAAAWHAAAAHAVDVPVLPEDAAQQALAFAPAYSSGPLVTVATRPQPPGAGRTIFFTGLSGSGKSTIARAVAATLAAERSVTLLDGDVVRTHLSRGLGFSKEDRDLNIRRIGWVAAEVTKHGGIAVCAPIAPYDETRRAVRAMVERNAGPGSFLLVWVSTPLEVCEQRDVKGLYAKARAGELRGFTGIDDPYEPPTDADLILDTATVALDVAVEQIVTLVHDSAN